MLTVKAVVSGHRTGKQDTFEILECANVRVHCEDLPTKDVDFMVDLFPKVAHGDVAVAFRSLPVGDAVGLYDAVYIMNETGRTVQYVRSLKAL